MLGLVVPLAALADWQACANVSWLSSGGQIARLDRITVRYYTHDIFDFDTILMVYE